MQIVGDITNRYRNGKRVELGFDIIKSNVVFLPEQAFNTES